jgi:hypothetical protein
MTKIWEVRIWEDRLGDPGGSLPYFSQCIPTLVSESVKNNGLRGDPGGSWMRRPLRATVRKEMVGSADESRREKVRCRAQGCVDVWWHQHGSFLKKRY